MRRLFALLASALLIVAACGGDQDPTIGPGPGETTTTVDAPAADPDGVDGDPDAVAVGEWREIAAAPTARQEVATAVVNGRIWMVGGFVGRAASAVVEVYDPAADSWEAGPDLPVAVHHPMATVYRGELVVAGGWDTANDPVDDVHVLRDGTWEALPPLRSPRAAGAAAAVDDTLVVLGGIGTDGLVGPIDVFDGEAWSAGPAIPTPRDHLAAVAHDGGVYAVGGREVSMANNVPALERFDVAAGAWEGLAPMPTARGGIGAAVHEGLLVAVGGEEPDGNFEHVEAFDFVTGEWRSLPPMRIPRHGHGVEVVDGTLYALVGGLQPGFGPTDIAEALELNG